EREDGGPRPMSNVLVCVKRVPDASGEVLLTADEQSVDGRYVGFTVSEHEECAVESAVQIASATGGRATVLTLGPAEAVEQLRGALAVGCAAAVHIEADPVAFGPADVARQIATVVREHEAAGTSYDVILLGNDAADSGDHQVGIRVAYELGRPVVNGVARVSVDAAEITAVGDGPDGQETYRVPAPAVVTILEGGVEPRYPTIPGRLRAKKIEIERRAPSATPAGPGRLRLTLPPRQPSDVQVLGSGAAAAGAVVALFERLGVTR
ncbi:MAG: electron transfer flavoprotein subunit beta/FixA family protein, partial [Nocardioides sp.]